jgi:hypothetical protein
MAIFHLGAELSLCLFKVIIFCPDRLDVNLGVSHQVGILLSKFNAFFQLNLKFLMVFNKILNVFWGCIFDVFENSSEVLDNITPGGLP